MRTFYESILIFLLGFFGLYLCIDFPIWDYFGIGRQMLSLMMFEPGFDDLYSLFIAMAHLFHFTIFYVVRLKGCQRFYSWIFKGLKMMFGRDNTR